MVEVRASRLAIEALADEGVVGEITREEVQTAATFAGTTQVQASRLSIEVLAQEIPQAGVTREEVQTAATFAGALEVQASRLSIEVLGAEAPQAGVTREEVQTAARFVGSAQVQASRISIECLARQGSAGPVTPLALADDAHIFLHNWVSRAEMTGSFRNDIVFSPDATSGAESRRGLTLKPIRSMQLEWMVCPSFGLAQIERLEVQLRRLTNARFQVPIYMDQRETLASAGAADVVVRIDTNYGRFFVGQRVALVRLDANYQVSSFIFRTIVDLAADFIEVNSTLGDTFPAGTIVFPMMDCEVMLEAEVDYVTARVPILRMTVVEAPGASQLPPLKSDTPAGATNFEGRPIWFEEPDWTDGIVKGRSRQGLRSSGGRADNVSVYGPRSRQTHAYNLTGKRENTWPVLEFFETRRGTLRSFWHIDHDQYITPLQIEASGNFVNVQVIGDLADMTEEFNYLGLVMNDGTTYVRRVSTVQEILTVFRLTLTTPLPAGLDAADVRRIARARLTRFKDDSFSESWISTGHMSCRADLIEVLNETDVST